MLQLKEYKNYLFRKEVVKVVILLIALSILFWPVLTELLKDLYINNNNSHGLVVPFISLYILWEKRSNLCMQPIQPSYIGLIALVACLIIYIVGYAGRIEILPRIAFVTAILSIVLYISGKQVFSLIVFPLFFLYFMIPVPVSIESLVSFKLQLWVTQISSAILSGLSFTVLREGNILYFANCSLEVAEACSGIRSLTAFIMIGCLFGYRMNGSFLRRSIMPLIAVPLSFVVNVARVTGTGILAHFYGSRVARGFLHEFSGIAVFLVGLVLFWGVYRIVEKKERLK